MYNDRFFRTWKGPFSFTQQAVKQNAPPKPGVYQILYLGQVAYIGISTSSILDRLTKHVTGHGNWAAARRSEARNYQFVFYECDGVSAKQIESHVITNNKPPFNVKAEYCNYIDNITVH